MATTKTPEKWAVIKARRDQRKLDQIIETWSPGDFSMMNRDWMKWTRCKLCKVRYCVNNNINHEIKLLRIQGVAVCARCYYSKGSTELIAMYKFVKMIANNEIPDTVRTRKALAELAKEIIGDNKAKSPGQHEEGPGRSQG